MGKMQYPPMFPWMQRRAPEVLAQIFWLGPLAFALLMLCHDVRATLATIPGLAMLVASAFAWIKLVRWIAEGGRFDESRLFPRNHLQGKVVVVTGANAGVGKNSAARFAKLGARVVMCSRDEKRGQEALDDVRRESGSTNIEVMSLDLSSMASVQQFVKEFLDKYERVDILNCNAGVMACAYGQTSEGHETQFGTNHLGHFLLTALLLPRLLASKGRVLTVSSAGHWLAEQGIDDDVIARLNNKATYDEWESYGISKLGNVLLARELDVRYGGRGLTAASLHPGAVRTDLTKHMAAALRAVMSTVGPLFLKSVVAGADTTMYCALEPKLHSGEYHQDSSPFVASRFGSDLRASQWLWDYSLRQTQDFITDPSIVALLKEGGLSLGGNSSTPSASGQSTPTPSSGASARQRKK